MEKNQPLCLSSALDRVKNHHRIYEMYYVEKKSRAEIFQETGLSRSSFYRILRTFESCNPQIAEEMKKQGKDVTRSEEHTSELQSRQYLVCRLLLEKKKKKPFSYCLLHHI